MKLTNHILVLAVLILTSCVTREKHSSGMAIHYPDGSCLSIEGRPSLSQIVNAFGEPRLDTSLDREGFVWDKKGLYAFCRSNEVNLLVVVCKSYGEKWLPSEAFDGEIQINHARITRRSSHRNLDRIGLMRAENPEVRRSRYGNVAVSAFFQPEEGNLSGSHLNNIEISWPDKRISNPSDKGFVQQTTAP